MQELFESMNVMLNNLNASMTRYVYDILDWDCRMFALVGPRGVGKTTLFLQRIKNDLHMQDCLYISADNIFFANHTLLKVAQDFSKQGGKFLFIDEVHKYAGWSRELKNIYDMLPDMHVYFTGSSVLDVLHGEADLSRRAPIFEMQGLSFREFLTMFHGIEAPRCTLEEILRHDYHIEGLAHPLPLFREYLERGYYPFGQDSHFLIELEQVINRSLESDIPQYANMTLATARKLKQLMQIVSCSVPYKPKMTSLASKIEASRNNIESYLALMEKAGMVARLSRNGSMSALGKTEKLYLDNPNIANALGKENSNVGNVRETFFFNQMRVNHVVSASSVADFEIADKVFEVGGKNKTGEQIKDVKNAFIVRDDIETGYGNVIPLWAFGLNY